MLHTTRFDKNSNLSITYLGKIDMTRAGKIKAEEKFPISEQGCTGGKLLDGTECQILLATGEVNHLCQKSHYLRCNSLPVCIQNAKNSSRQWTVC